MPNVVSIAKTDKTIVFTGTNFYTSGYVARASFFGIEANEWNDVSSTKTVNGKSVTVVTPTETVNVVVNSATQVTATWKYGVPTTSSTLIKPVLYFVKDSSKVKIYAISDQVLTNTLSLTSSSSSLQCSYAGGCSFNVKATAGLMSIMKERPTENYIKVCEKKCTLIEKTSTAGDINCSTPPLSTIYSNDNFGIEVESESLNSGVYFGTASDKSYSKAFNLINTDQVNDKNVKCNVGMEFKFGYVGILSQVKWFLDNIPDRAAFQNNVEF